MSQRSYFLIACCWELSAVFYASAGNHFMTRVALIVAAINLIGALAFSEDKR